MLPVFVGAVSILGTHTAHAADLDGDGVDNAVDAYPSNNTASSLQGIPAVGQYGSLVFEDLWPAQGDFDFNDVVIDHNIQLAKNNAGQVVALKGTFYIRAHGAKNRAGLSWRLPINRTDIASASISTSVGVDQIVAVANGNTTTRNLNPVATESDTVFDLVADLRTILNPQLPNAGAGDPFVNTNSNTATSKGALVSVTIFFNNPVNLSAVNAPYDLYIFDAINTGRQIHRTQFGGTDRMNASLFGQQDDGSNASRKFVTTGGIPFVLELPVSAQYPQEGTRIEALYPRIVSFATSGGVTDTDFFNTPANGAGFTAGAAGSLPPIAPNAAPLFLPDTISNANSYTLDPLAQRAYIKASNSNIDDQFAAAIAASGNTVVVGAPSEDADGTAFTGSGAVYVYEFDPQTFVWTEHSILRPTELSAGDDFGAAVDIDGNTLVVGSPNEDSNAVGINGNQANNSSAARGAVFVYTRIDVSEGGTGAWSLQAYVKADSVGGGDQFGSAVAIHQDTLIVGAIREDSNATGVNGNGADNSITNAGAAYIFVRNGSTWSQQAYLKAHQVSSEDLFGSVVAIHGNIAAVGAAQEDGSSRTIDGAVDEVATNAGAVYVYVRDPINNTWSFQSYLKPNNLDADDRFGSSISIDSDEISTSIIVGAVREDSISTVIDGDATNNTRSNAGAVYVFDQPIGSTLWTQSNYLKASKAGPGDLYGSAVIYRNHTLLVGTPIDDMLGYGVNPSKLTAFAEGSGSGAVYVYTRDANTHAWAEHSYIKASNAQTGDQFGKSIAITETAFVVGAPLEDSNAQGTMLGYGEQSDERATSTGALYAFHAIPSTPVINTDALAQTAYLKASNTDNTDQFGTVSAADGDTLVVGVPLEDSNTKGINTIPNENAGSSGAAYVYVRNAVTGAWTQQAYIKSSNTDFDDRFGTSIAISGDTMVVGAPREDSSSVGVNGVQNNDGFTNAGAAYVFVRNPATGVWIQQAYLKASNPSVNDQFGTSVAVDGDTIVVGAPLEDTIEGDAGAAYVFVRNPATGVWSQQALLVSNKIKNNDFFGTAVAVSGNWVAIGSPNDDSPARGVNHIPEAGLLDIINAGAVYMFERDQTGVWTEKAFVKSHDRNQSHVFGTNIAMRGDRLAVGVPTVSVSGTGVNQLFGNTVTESGSAYVFERNTHTNRWSQTAVIKPELFEVADLFGQSISLGDGFLVVGATGEDSIATGINGNANDNTASVSGPSVGAAYLFVLDADHATWIEKAYLKASNSAAGDAFGASVAAGDGWFAVAATDEDSNAVGINGDQTSNSAGNSGACYIYEF